MPETTETSHTTHILTIQDITNTSNVENTVCAQAPFNAVKSQQKFLNTVNHQRTV